MIRLVNALRLGAAVRAVRVRRRLRQRDVGALAGVSQSVVSRLERGHVETLTLGHVETICASLDIRVDVLPRWRGGDLDRLLNSTHAALHEAIARWFDRRAPGWQLAPEVSFAIYGERGVIDVLAWRPTTRTLLVIELKSQLVDLNELVGTLDRKRRLAKRIGRERGWDAGTVGSWVVVASTRTNRRHAADHAAFLRNAFPHNGRAVRAWLSEPTTPLAALSLESFGAGRKLSGPTKRVAARRYG
jgi:transcriptional regulator with XRE-family HTH domain